MLPKRMCLARPTGKFFAAAEVDSGRAQERIVRPSLVTPQRRPVLACCQFDTLERDAASDDCLLHHHRSAEYGVLGDPAVPGLRREDRS